MSKTLPAAELLWQQFDYDPLRGRLIRKLSGGEKKPQRLLAHTTNGYRSFCIGGTFYEHRLVWKWVTGEEPGGHVDHRNRDRQCNRFGNLRLLPDSLNRWTTTKPGYHWRQDRNCFAARVSNLNGKKLCFYTKSEEEAKNWVLEMREEVIQAGLRELVQANSAAT